VFEKRALRGPWRILKTIYLSGCERSERSERSERLGCQAEFCMIKQSERSSVLAAARRISEPKGVRGGRGPGLLATWQP
jgi:hypothetical protein